MAPWVRAPVPLRTASTFSHWLLPRLACLQAWRVATLPKSESEGALSDEPVAPPLSGLAADRSALLSAWRAWQALTRKLRPSPAQALLAEERKQWRRALERERARGEQLVAREQRRAEARLQAERAKWAVEREREEDARRQEVERLMLERETLASESEGLRRSMQQAEAEHGAAVREAMAAAEKAALELEESLRHELEESLLAACSSARSDERAACEARLEEAEAKHAVQVSELQASKASFEEQLDALGRASQESERRLQGECRDLEARAAVLEECRVEHERMRRESEEGRREAERGRSGAEEKLGEAQRRMEELHRELGARLDAKERGVGRLHAAYEAVLVKHRALQAEHHQLLDQLAQQRMDKEKQSECVKAARDMLVREGEKIGALSRACVSACNEDEEAESDAAAQSQLSEFSSLPDKKNALVYVPARQPAFVISTAR